MRRRPGRSGTQPDRPRAMVRALLSVLAAAILIGSPAAAQDGQAGQPRTWGVQPASKEGPSTRAAFTYDAAPGETISDAVRIANFSDRPLTLSVYATDAFNTDEGTFDVLAADAQPDDVGSWVQLERTEVTLEARASTDIPFTLTVPANASPGDHAGGIVASLATDAVDGAGNKVKVDNRVGSRIYLRVDGPLRPELTVTELDLTYDGTTSPIGKGKAEVRYTIENTGNARLSAEQALTLSGPFGLASTEVELDDVPELLPGSTLQLRAPATEVFPAGRLTAELELMPKAADDVDVDPTATAATVWAVPWTLLALIALLVIALVVRRRLKRRKAVAPVEAAGSDPALVEPAAE